MRYAKTLGIGIAAMVVAGCNSTGEATEAETIQTAQAERGNLRITAEATGTVEPIRKVEVKSKASGEILRLHVDIGDVVEAGDLLAEVDPRDVRNRYEQAEADLEVAQTRADIARAQVDRQEELHEAGVITEQELENAQLENANARANLIKARTNKDLAELQLTDVTIRAPMAGTILEKNIEEGQVIQSASQNVSGGTTLYVMAALADMQVRTLVDETDMGELTAGLIANVQVEAFPDRQFQGLVEKIEPQATVEQNVTMFPVIVHLNNRSGLLKPGMNAEVEILIDEANDVLLVPNNAVVMPQDVGPAAMALGLDLESIDLSRFGRGGFGGRLAGGAAARGGGSPAGGTGAARQGAGSTGENGAAPGSAPDGGAAGARLDSLRARVQRGEISRDSLRTLMAAFRQGAPDGGDAGDEAGDEAARGSRRTRRAAVFVVNAQGQPEPRMVEIGLNDWDQTQVVSGIDEGDRIAIIGAAQLRQQQQQFIERIRGRSNGPFGR